MKILKLTDSQVENLKDFIEIEFIQSIRNDDAIDNIGYLIDMCDIYKQLTEQKEGADNG